MKKDYIKPVIEIEEFELNAAIAAGCTIIVNLGPGDETHGPCDKYSDGEDLNLQGRSATNFYETTCSCYLSSVGGGLATS